MAKRDVHGHDQFGADLDDDELRQRMRVLARHADTLLEMAEKEEARKLIIDGLGKKAAWLSAILILIYTASDKIKAFIKSVAM